MMLIACSQEPVGVTGGGGSETIASLIPHVDGFDVKVESESAFSVTASVYSESYSPKDTGYFHRSTILSDDNSLWRLSGLTDSVYHIFVSNPENGHIVFFRYGSGDHATEKMDEKILTSGGTLSGTVMLRYPDGTSEPVAGSSVYLPGSSFATQTDSRGEYRFTGIPEGQYSVDAELSMYSRKGVSEEDRIEIVSDSLTIKNFIFVSP